eukprot:12204475-Alexandrium_andersonii.AAC.1
MCIRDSRHAFVVPHGIPWRPYMCCAQGVQALCMERSPCVYPDIRVQAKLVSQIISDVRDDLSLIHI